MFHIIQIYGKKISISRAKAELLQEIATFEQRRNKDGMTNVKASGLSSVSGKLIEKTDVPRGGCPV